MEEMLSAKYSSSPQLLGHISAPTRLLWLHLTDIRWGNKHFWHVVQFREHKALPLKLIIAFHSWTMPVITKSIYHIFPKVQMASNKNIHDTFFWHSFSCPFTCCVQYLSWPQKLHPDSWKKCFRSFCFNVFFSANTLSKMNPIIRA